MKRSEKSVILVGILLLIIAAYFTISVMVQFFGIGSKTELLKFFYIGRILIGAYGYSAILIPVFLFASAIVFFMPNFNGRKAILLGSSLLPFFTVAASESILRKILPGSSQEIFILKLVATILLALLLIAIEYVAVGVIFDAIARKDKKEKKIAAILSENDKVNDDSDCVVAENQVNDALDINSIKLYNEGEFSKSDTSAKFSLGVNSDDASQANVSAGLHADTGAVVDKATYVDNAENSRAYVVGNVSADVNADTDDDSDVSAASSAESNSVVKLSASAVLDNSNAMASSKGFDEIEFPISDLYSQDDEARFLEDPFSDDIDDESRQSLIQSSNTSAGSASVSAESADVSAGANSVAQSCASAVVGSETCAPTIAESETCATASTAEDEGQVFQIEFNSDSEKKEPRERPLILNFEKKTVTKERPEYPEFMSEEEKMNKAVPLMDVKLGDDDFSEGAARPAPSDEPETYDTAARPAPSDELKTSEGAAHSALNDSAQNDDTVAHSALNDAAQNDDPAAHSALNDSAQNDDPADDDADDDDDICDIGDYIEGECDDDETISVDDDEDVLDDEAESVEKSENTSEIYSVPHRQRNKPYAVPTEGLLTTYPDGEYWIIDEETKQKAVKLKEILNEFKIEAEVTGIKKGPVITMFEMVPAPGVKLSKIVGLSDNIALGLAASSVRIVAPIPGKSAVGIEIPNKERAIVSFKEIIETDTQAFKKMAIPVVLGKDITGDAQLLDLAKTPHLLIAGSTGSGKSVCVNSLILSILYKRSPNEVKLILIDPKVVELKLYNDIPHLLTPVITEPKRAFQALQYCLCEMERRYALLDGMGVRDIKSYNKRIVERNIATEKLPYIVVVIDEFADLMATTGKELESTIARLAAMSRAVGIHLVLATQRPSIDVITGLIKANIPTRIAFMVASKTDSRVIIDQVGADKLLGSGDMLYASATDPFPVRIQGTYVSDNEVENVVDYVKQYGEPEYIDEEIFVDDDEDMDMGPTLFDDGNDPLYNQALDIIVQSGKASASYLQRRLKIGYNRAARLIEEMEERGIVGPANGSKPRDIIHMP